MVFVDGEGVPSPAPPRVISPWSGVWADAGEGHNQGRHPGPAFPGLSGVGEERRRRGRGGGERRAVSGFTFPGLRPAQALTTKNPAPGRGTLGKAGMVFVDGEGVPSPAPPQVISPRSGVWDDTGEGHDRSWLSGRPFRGYHDCCPLSSYLENLENG